jgi:hypothetical protein
VIHKILEDKELGHFCFSTTGGSKEQVYPLCIDFMKHKIPKEQASGHFGILATRGSEGKGTGGLTREVPVPDKCPFRVGARSRTLVMCFGSSHLVPG